MTGIRQEKILGQMEKFCAKDGQHISYMIATADDKGNVKLHERRNRPCYGEMRSYKEKSRNRPNDPFPGDLQNNFPDGTPVGCCLVVDHLVSAKPEVHNRFIRWLFSAASPYARVIGDADGSDIVFFYKDKVISGVGILHGDFEPTLMVALWMYIRYCCTSTWCPIHKADVWNDLVSNGTDPLTAFIVANAINYNGANMSIQPYSNTGYYLTGYLDLKRIYDRDPRDLDGDLWSNRTDYNRPEIQDLFLDTSAAKEDVCKLIVKAIPSVEKNFPTNDRMEILPKVAGYILERAKAA